MRMKVGQEPCILYETIELLYAYINGIPAERLTGLTALFRDAKFSRAWQAVEEDLQDEPEEAALTP